MNYDQESSIAIYDVMRERIRQVTMEGFDARHDDVHTKREIVKAAICYLFLSYGSLFHYMQFWPWDLKWWKPKDRRYNLVRAAALVVAEIERLDRKEGKTILNKSESEPESHGGYGSGSYGS